MKCGGQELCDTGLHNGRGQDVIDGGALFLCVRLSSVGIGERIHAAPPQRHG